VTLQQDLVSFFKTALFVDMLCIRINDIPTKAQSENATKANITGSTELPTAQECDATTAK
jgi:hypothetical protein